MTRPYASPKPVSSKPLSATVHVVANRLGHSDPAVTLRVYAHVLRESVAGVADVFAKAVERAGVSKSVSKKVAEYNETRGSTL